MRSWPLKKPIIFGAPEKNVRSVIVVRVYCVSHQEIHVVYHRFRATQVAEQRLGRYGNFRSRDFVRNRFITDTCDQLLKDDQLGLGTSGRAQVFQNSDAILIGPIVEHVTEEEYGSILLGMLLFFEEVLRLVIECQRSTTGAELNIDKPWSFTRPASSAPGRFFFQYCNSMLSQNIR